MKCRTNVIFSFFFGKSHMNSGYSLGFLAKSPEGDVLIDSRDGAVTGAVPEFWDRLVAKLADTYDSSIDLEWKVYDTSQETFDALLAGDVDSACGYWFPTGEWQPPDGNFVARPLAFSMFQCPSFLETVYIYTSIESNVDSFSDLLMQAGGDEDVMVCVAGTFLRKNTHCVVCTCPTPTTCLPPLKNSILCWFY